MFYALFILKTLFIFKNKTLESIQVILNTLHLTLKFFALSTQSTYFVMVKLCFCGPLCDSNKQLDWVCILNYHGKPCNLQGRTASSQENLDKSRLRLIGSGWLVSGCLHEHSSEQQAYLKWKLKKNTQNYYLIFTLIFVRSVLIWRKFCVIFNIYFQTIYFSLY